MRYDNWQEYSVGRDPRSLAEYERLRAEINKLSHSRHPPVDWSLIHQLATGIFARHGVDLQTAVYFVLAHSRLHGLSGFTEGCELLCGLIVTQWENFWPPEQQQRARTDILDWFIARTSDLLRQYIVTRDDKRLIYRCEHALTQISEKLHNAGLPRVPRIENLLHYTESQIRKLDEPEIMVVADEPPLNHNKARTPPVVYLHTSDTQPDDLPKGSLLVSQQATRLRSVSLKIRRRRGWRWFLAGGACGMVLAGILSSGLFYWQHRQRQTLALLENPFARFPASLSDDDIRQLRSQLSTQALRQQETSVIQHWRQAMRQLQALPPDFACQYADTLHQSLRRLYPDSLTVNALNRDWQHQQASARTENTAQQGWLAASHDTDQLISQLLELERTRKNVTISYLKTAVYNLRDQLTRQPPTDITLWRLEQQLAAGQPVSAAHISQLSQQLGTLGLRLCLLRTGVQAIQPETDNGQQHTALPLPGREGTP